MKLRHTLCATLTALLPLCTLTLAPTAAHAQQYERGNAPAPAIRGFNVNEVRRLAPGVELHFDLYGTPGGNATLRIDGATRNVYMTETEPGQYVGTYTIGNHDRITNTSAVTANLRVGNRVATGVLSESVVRDGAPRPNRRGDLAGHAAHRTLRSARQRRPGAWQRPRLHRLRYAGRPRRADDRRRARRVLPARSAPRRIRGRLHDPPRRPAQPRRAA